MQLSETDEINPGNVIAIVAVNVTFYLTFRYLFAKLVVDHGILRGWTSKPCAREEPSSAPHLNRVVSAHRYWHAVHPLPTRHPSRSQVHQWCATQIRSGVDVGYQQILHGLIITSNEDRFHTDNH